MSKTPPTTSHDSNATPLTGYDSYRSPLESRNASREMRALWSEQRKFSTWRRIWLALAESQHELGMPVTRAQVDAIAAHLDDIDFAAAAAHETRLRHDVMAHVHTLGDAAPEARAIIHFGATSQDVVCNADTLVLRDALALICGKLARVIDRLASFAAEHRDLPTLGFTHFQPAQPTTVGKRATLWAQDFAIALEQCEFVAFSLRLRGLRGATGTQASYLGLFDGDASKVDELEARFADKLGWPRARMLAVCGQTYPRLVDAQIISALSIAAAAAHKCATDIRLLANRKEIEEPFEKDQIGSSAMAYKRNPMRCERACGLARFVMGLVNDPLATAATQWLERTLDDSSNRRLVLPEAFLALDGTLDIMSNVCEGLVVWSATVAANLAAELPFMASENIMLAATKAGADRQEAHEVIRVHSMAAADEVKRFGRANDLMARLARDPFFANVDLANALDPASFIGRAPEQTDRFITSVADPIRARYADAIQARVQLRV